MRNNEDYKKAKPAWGGFETHASAMGGLCKNYSLFTRKIKSKLINFNT